MTLSELKVVAQTYSLNLKGSVCETLGNFKTQQSGMQMTRDFGNVKKKFKKKETHKPSKIKADVQMFEGKHSGASFWNNH